MSVHFPESLLLASILAERFVCHQERLWIRRLAKDYLETNPITIKPKTASHEAEQFSWVPLPSCSPPGRPFPIKSLALSAHVSPWTIHFWVLDKSPVLGPGRGPLPATLGQQKKSNQSILKEINPEYPLQELMLKLKHQYLGHLMLTANPTGKDPDSKKVWRQEEKGSDRGWDGLMASLTQWTWVWANSGRQWRTGKPGILLFMGSQRIRHDLPTEQHQQPKQNKGYK